MAGLSVVETARVLRDRFNHSEFRQLIQELVSLETAVASSETAVSSGARQEPKRFGIAGECTCPCVCSPMNPALWGTLPDELLQRIFARLPLPDLTELRCLSKRWNRRFSSKDPGFVRVCSEASPRMFALIAEGNDRKCLDIRLYDTEANIWCSNFTRTVGESYVGTMSAGDGGLVCIVDTVRNGFAACHLLAIRVQNPLTGETRNLPQQGLGILQPCMLQLVMNEDTKCYKVILVGENEYATHRTAEVYCSETGLWSSAEAFPDLIFGYRYKWTRCGIGDALEESLEINLGACAYDCGGRLLQQFTILGNPCLGVRLEAYALLKDHLFILHQERCGRGLDPHVISEYRYQGRNCESAWIEVRVHKCEGFEHVLRFDVTHVKLHACKGFLLLKAFKDGNGDVPEELTWLYDLCTTKWQKVPNVPEADIIEEFDAMFELRWDAVP